MSRHFPIFIDVATVPPLVVGAGDSVEAKIRLLRKFSPQIDFVTDGTRSRFESCVPGIGVLPARRLETRKPCSGTSAHHHRHG